jgi:PAS domain S-box-containing protein
MSERPQAVLSPYESELRFQALFDAAAEFIFVIDPDGCILLTNRYVSTQSGYSPEELAGKHIKAFFTDHSKELCDCNFPELRNSGHSRAEVEFVCKNGCILQMECSATAIPDKHGKFTSFLIIQRDITERKRAAAELADSERRFRAIFNSTFQFIGLLSPDGILLEANRAALESVAVSDREVVGKPFWDTPWWSGFPEEQQRLQAAIRKASRGELVRYETRHTDKGGKIVHIDFSLKPVKNEQGETVLIIPEGRDITERRMAEEAACQHQQELAHLMRLSIMGEIAASMAHELNQPLTALISYCGTALSQLNEMPSVPDRVLDILAHANEQAHRASEIIQHIRNFISKKNSSRRPVDIDRTILEMSRFLDRELRTSHVELSLDLGGQGHLIMADSVQIEQVLINLIRNSIEAIHNAGIIDGRLVLQTRLPDAGSLEVTVSDNGPGIEPAMCNCLFEPFQTSKETGMGMGLSISRSIIQAHEGKIWLETTGPRGTTFCIRLPLLKSKP